MYRYLAGDWRGSPALQPSDIDRATLRGCSVNSSVPGDTAQRMCTAMHVSRSAPHGDAREKKKRKERKKRRGG